MICYVRIDIKIIMHYNKSSHRTFQALNGPSITHWDFVMAFVAHALSDLLGSQGHSDRIHEHLHIIQ